MTPSPTLEAVWAAVKSAQAHGWTREAIGARLRTAGATWGATGLAACPEGARTALVSDFGHHPTWPADQKRFCATLRDLGVTYGEVAAVCDAADPPMPRPSQVGAVERGEIVASLLSCGWWMAAVTTLRGMK